TVPGSGEGTTLPTDLDPGCAVHLMTTVPVGSHGTGGEEATPGPSGPTGTSSSIDTALGTFVDELPDGTTVLLAGLGHVEGRAGATLLVVHPVGAVAAGTGGPGSQGDSTGAALTSGSTQQRSLVQLTDLTATLLQLVGAGGPLPEAVAGQPVVAVGDGPDTGHLEDARDLAAGITLAKVAAPWVLGTVAAVHLALLVLSIARRRQRASAPPGRTGGLSVVATAVLAIPAATFLTGLVPWWGFVRPVAALSLGVLVAVGLVTAVAWAGPWRRQPLGPAAVVAAITLAVVGADVICSARLGLVSVLGLQPVTAGRFYGQGNVGFGIVLGSFLVLAAAVIGDRPAARPAARPATGPADGPEVSRPAAAGAILLLGAAAVLLNAAPQAGADFGGVPALVVATGLMALAALGIRWSAGALALLGLAGVVVAAGVMLLDWTRGPGRRTHLGDFVQRVVDGTALQVVTRKLEQSLGILLSYPLSWLAVLALVLLALAVWRRPAGWTAPLWRHEGMHRALLAGVVATTLGWVLNDSGIAVVALALTVLLAAALSLIGSEPPRTDDGPAPGGLQLVPGAVAPERPGDGPPSAVDPRRDG
ncbi:MAG TPA: hypothetical protein VLO09_06345, partial [Ornithinimicrobium sp.]|nr:hypothetical protein [Ornithinimicrobium sp.]